MNHFQWLDFPGQEEIPTPALVIHRTRVQTNLERMLAMVKTPENLRPHLKTHKLPQVIAMQVALGIRKCKCATIAEAEMAAQAGATDILIALQLVGPHQSRLANLVENFPHVKFSTVVDDLAIVTSLNACLSLRQLSVDVLLDLNIGQDRTGITPDEAALNLYRQIAQSSNLRPGGLHAYDGHLHQNDPVLRAEACAQAFLPVLSLRDAILAESFPVPTIVAGGTPTFPFHAQRTDLECSPGTCVLHDASYRQQYPDLDFLVAAQLLTRVISRPSANRVCLDLGHKAVASEMPQPRAIFPTLPDAKIVLHSEEHLVLQTESADKLVVGSLIHAIPWHICPTVALHDRVYVTEPNQPVVSWPVTARARLLRL